MANKRKYLKLPDPKVGEVYYDRDNNAYLRITEVINHFPVCLVRFNLKQASEAVYTPSYELSMTSFKLDLSIGRFIKWSPTVRILYT